MIKEQAAIASQLAKKYTDKIAFQNAFIDGYIASYKCDPIVISLHSYIELIHHKLVSNLPITSDLTNALNEILEKYDRAIR